MLTISITLIILILTVLTSIAAFSSPKVMDDLIFNPPAITFRQQWYRFITSGFIHADYMHLAFNMLALYSFGRFVEMGFLELFGSGMGKLLYATMYLLALLVCLLPTYMQHKENGNYRSLGASGAVSAVVFAGLMLDPTIGIGILFIPIPIKGYIFGPLFLIISGLLGKQGRGNINHSAHIWGAVFGVVFIIGAAYLFAHYPLLEVFVQKIRSDIGR